MKNGMDIIVVDFSGVYDFESFASGRKIVHVDCRGLNGVDCYCDADGRNALRKTLAPYPAKALHSRYAKSAMGGHGFLWRLGD